MKQSIQLRIQQREKEAPELRQAIFSLTVSASAQFALLHRRCLTTTFYDSPSKQWSLVYLSIVLCLQRTARAAVEESDAVFTELIQSIELKRFEVRELIKAQEKTAVSQAEQLLDKIQKEITELKKHEAELDRLCHTDDHIHFLQVLTLRLECFKILRLCINKQCASWSLCL